MELLITQQNIDVNLVDKDGRTPLLLAVEKEYTKIVKLLMRIRDIDINMKDRYGRTVLQIARSRRDRVITVLLIMAYTLMQV